MQFHVLFKVNNSFQQHTKFLEKIEIFQVHDLKGDKAQPISLSATSMLSNIQVLPICMVLFVLPFYTFFLHLNTLTFRSST